MIRFIYRAYQLIILLPLLVVSTFILGVLIMVVSPLLSGRSRANFCSAIGRCWGKLLVRATFLPVTVIGSENIRKDQSYVIVANHQSCYDIFLMIGFLRSNIRWMMKAPLMKIFVLGRASRLCGHIAVDTSTTSKAYATIEQACHTITDGVSLAVFPEGHRTLDGNIGKFKRGAFNIADKLQLPVLPVTIKGTFQVMPKPRDFKFAEWHPLTMVIHEPIYPIGTGKENVNFLMDEAYRTISNETLLQQ